MDYKVYDKYTAELLEGAIKNIGAHIDILQKADNELAELFKQDKEQLLRVYSILTKKWGQ